VTVADFLGHEEHVKDAFHAGITQRLQVGIYTIPEVGMVGETEESLKKKGVAYIVGRANYRENARGRIIGDLDGFLKLLFRQDDLKLIGVHIMGDLATDVVHIGLVAMMCNASANLFVDACLNMPTLGVLYKTATLNALQNIPPSESQPDQVNDPERPEPLGVAKNDRFPSTLPSALQLILVFVIERIHDHPQL
jgi:NAD(P) transhydrogenase